MKTTFSYRQTNWTMGSDAEISVSSPHNGETIYTFGADSASEVNQAVLAARQALTSWEATSISERESILLTYAEKLKANAEAIAQDISAEAGKPAWEAATEVATMVGKIQLSINAYQQRCAEFGNGDATTRYKAHGVLAVFGPFNFPGHLPNGHIVPALLAGNTVVFKPSEHTPKVATWIVKLLLESGLPEQCIQLVQGQRETGEALANHRLIDGLAFTGSAKTGEFLGRCFAENPGKMLALELGGNNPLVVWDVADTDAAALTILQSAFITAGQRCTCARRLILPKDSQSDALLSMLAQKTDQIRVGSPNDEPAPFSGPVIDWRTAEHLLKAQEELEQSGGKVVSRLSSMVQNTGLLKPGIIDVTSVQNRKDEEYFGPLLQVIRVDSFEDAIQEANDTSYGLVSGLLSDSEQHYRQFYAQARAGLINWNYPLPGASGAAPFGGIGRSGNLRPSGFFAADYCSYPVASMEKQKLQFPEKTLPGLWS